MDEPLTTRAGVKMQDGTWRIVPLLIPLCPVQNAYVQPPTISFSTGIKGDHPRTAIWEKFGEKSDCGIYREI